MPNQSLGEDVPDLESEPPRKQLPRRHTREALANPRWKVAMNEEMKSLLTNKTLELVDCPLRKKPVGCRWVYNIKYQAYGVVECFKTRLPLQQFDVKNAFLHGELSEEVYMNLLLRYVILETHSKKSNVDHNFFLKKQQGKITTLIVYVDDMVVTGNDHVERMTLQSYLSIEFEMKDLGPLKFFIANTPLEEGLKLCVQSNQVPIDKRRCQRLVRRLMYLAHNRSNLAYAYC
ncbi:putative mitochondrial protein, partial [Mucuna pruriens]